MRYLPKSALREVELLFPTRELQVSGGLAITCTSLGKAFGLTGVNHANVIIENDDLRSEFFEAAGFADHFGSIDPMLHAAL
jgi:bifunctional pyridoxal-dependent enzyme with beta-cystathionase and maltose regulon repressor activities